MPLNPEQIRQIGIIEKFRASQAHHVDAASILAADFDRRVRKRIARDTHAYQKELGELYFEHEFFVSAAECYVLAIKYSTGTPPHEYWHALGVCYTKLDRPDDAEEAFANALELAPYNERYVVAMAQCLSKQNKHKEEEKLLRGAFDRNKNSLSINVQLGNCLLSQKKPDQAEEFFVRAERLDQDYLNYPKVLTHIYEQVGHLEAAIGAAERTIDKALQIRHTDPETYDTLIAEMSGAKRALEHTLSSHGDNHVWVDSYGDDDPPEGTHDFALV